MSTDFKKYMAYLLTFCVVMILLITVVLPAGKKGIQHGTHEARQYVSCTLSMCSETATPVQTSQNQ